MVIVEVCLEVIYFLILRLGFFVIKCVVYFGFDDKDFVGIIGINIDFVEVIGCFFIYINFCWIV